MYSVLLFKRVTTLITNDWSLFLSTFKKFHPSADEDARSGPIFYHSGPLEIIFLRRRLRLTHAPHATARWSLMSGRDVVRSGWLVDVAWRGNRHVACPSATMRCGMSGPCNVWSLYTCWTTSRRRCARWRDHFVSIQSRHIISCQIVM